MSLLFKSLIFVFGGCILTNYASAQTKSKITTKVELDSLFKMKQLDSSLVRKRIKTLLNSSDEKEWLLASNYYYKLGDLKTMDSLKTAQLKKYPNGFIARQNSATLIYKLVGANAQDSAYKLFVKKFPIEKFTTGEEGQFISYDYLRSAIANSYASEGNITQADYYVGMLQERFWKNNAYYGLANIYLNSNKLELAEKYAKMAVDSTLPYAKGERGNSGAAMFAKGGLGSILSLYGNILLKEDKVSSATEYLESIFPYVQKENTALLNLKAHLFAYKGAYNQALEQYNILLESGKADSIALSGMRNVYAKMNGSEEGFDQYIQDKQAKISEKLKDSLSKSILNESAPSFSLKDLNGNIVSLKDYKDKVVILDFWATWCAPCKASFPAMQMTIDKYKNDPNVAFLFIHTWETSVNPQADVSAFLKGKNYSFEILFDNKDSQTKENKVVKSYGVTGIPAKFVIGKDGNIKFKLKGFEGSNIAAVNELSAMIELAK